MHISFYLLVYLNFKTISTYKSLRKIVVVLGCVCAWKSEAQTQDTIYYPNYRLKEVTVSAPRLPQNKASIPMSITQLDSSSLLSSQQNLSVKEYLQLVPGVYVQNAYNFAQDARISIRGFGATAAFGIRGIKLIVDGIPETTPDGTGQLDNLNLDLIEQMTIIRGTTSSIYGNASGGAIIVNSDFGFQDNFLQSETMFGSYGYYSQSISGGVKDDQTTYTGHVRFFGSDGYRDNSQFKQVNSRLAIKHQFSERLTGVFLTEFVHSPEGQDAGGLTLEDAEDNPTQARDRNLTFDAGESIRQWKAGASLDWKWTENKELNSYAFFNQRVFDGKLPLENAGQIALQRNYFGFGNKLNIQAKKHAIKIGYDLLSQQDMRSRFDNLEGVKGALVFDQTESFLNFGLFAMDYLELDRWYVTGGIRYDLNKLEADDRFWSDGDDSGSRDIANWSYQLGIGRTLSPTLQAFVNYSNSFETPTLNQLSNRPDNGGGFEALNAATANTFEGGLKWTKQKLKAELVGFITQTENELVPYELAAFPERTFFRNAGDTQRKGIELAAAYLSKSLRIQSAYTYSRFSYETFIQNGTDLSGFQLPGIPTHHATFAITAMPSSRWEISIPVDYVGSLFADNANQENVNSYLEMAVSVRYSTQVKNVKIVPYAGIRNLTNTAYFDNIRINAFGSRYYEAAPERNFYIGLSLRLDDKGAE